jgi:adenylate cyclase
MPRPTHSSLRAVVAVALLVAVVVVGGRRLGLLESVELSTYDWFIRMRPADPPPDPRITLVTVTEADIPTSGGWPLSDDVLARVIEQVARHGPRAIGVDMYRDVPVPPGTENLNRVLAGQPRVVVVMKFGEGASSGVRPPPVLKDTEQVGFNDIVVDPGGVVRRALLFLDDGQTSVSAFALRLALLYLQGEGVTAQPAPENPALLRLGRTTIRPLEPNDGGYVGVDAGGYQFLVDFQGARRPFRSVDLTSLLAGHVDPGLLSDKLVLIGVTAESIKDDFYTPFSRGLSANQYVPGVAVHAHIASQILRMALNGQTPMRTLPDWQESLWIALWSGAGALLAFGVRSPWRLAAAVTGGLLVLAGFDFLAFLRTWWVPLVPPTLAWLASAGIVIAYTSYQETLQRTMLMQLFSRHVSKEVAEAIWQQRDQFLAGARPRSERLVVTALFTDLSGFTTVAEKHSPEQLMEWLNEYMDVMAQQVSRYGGVIRQYAGDSVVAVFGVPVARRIEAEIARDARSAVECALAMETALRALNQRWRAEGKPVSGMRVGIFTGPVVAGTLGSAERSEYVVVGDTMNTAARLESFDKEYFPPDPETRPCRTIIGESTLACLGDEFETARVGDVSLKGKEQRVGIYRVIGRRLASPITIKKEVSHEHVPDPRVDLIHDGRDAGTVVRRLPAEAAGAAAEPADAGRGQGARL